MITRNMCTIDATGKYELAVELVQMLDELLRRGYHLRDCFGRVLTELDQVVLAILENRWPAEGVTNNENNDANNGSKREFNRTETRPVPEPA